MSIKINYLKSQYKQSSNVVLFTDEKFNLSIVNKKKINKLISSVNSKINQIKEGKDLSKKFLRNILKRIISLSTYLNRIKKHNKISKSLNELVFFAKNLNSQKKSLMKLKNFKKFWGHGTFILAINKE